MSENDSPSLELMQLVGAALDGDIERHEMERLQELLRHDPAARAYYLDTASLHSALDWEHRSANMLGENATPGSRRRNLPHWAMAASIAALLAVAAIIVSGSFRGKDKPPTAASPAGADSTEGPARLHARVTAIDGLQPGLDPVSNGALTLGEWLPDGNLRLKSGRVTLTFDSGAMLSASGPVEFDIEGPNRGFLRYGKVAVYVPEQAVGFVLNTPTSSILDLGTRFGALVDRNGNTEVHVIEGSVEVADVTLASGGELRRLSTGEAVHIGPAAVDAPQFRGAEFEPEFSGLVSPGSLGEINSVHWSFDEGSGRSTEGRGSDGSVYVGVLKGGSNGERSWTQGIKGSALALQGERDWLSTDYPGIGDRSPRTVAFWINLPPQAAGSEVPAILTWGGFESNGGKWELVPNPYGYNGAVGALRLSCNDGFVVGTADIQNGRWHHVAVVYSGGAGADIVNQVRLYIDGKLDPLSGFLRGEVNTDIRSAGAVPLTIGRYVDPTQPIRGYLRGAIDELYIFDGALTPHQISKLAEER